MTSSIYLYYFKFIFWELITAQKQKKIRLTGKALAKLNEYIYDRDHRHCIICETWVAEGTKFHHVKLKSHGGEDVKENGVLLCMSCHTEVHCGRESQDYRERCVEYLGRLYGG
jgi:5-methylcytosine-specific restriction endonuclease McrA